jgi:hypothetical protein
MARYNTALTTSTVSSGTNPLTTPGTGLFTEFTGTSYSITIPDPTQYTGQTQTFWNNASGTITLNTPSGQFKGAGASGSTAQTLTAGNTMILASDGANYVMVYGQGGPVTATTLTATSTVTFQPASANVVISPSGTGTVTISPSGTGALTINPTTASTMDNVRIGGSTPLAGSFTTISATNQITSTLATGTAPFSVSSSTLVSNLNAQYLSGATFASPGSIGSTTAGAANFTTLGANAQVSFTAGTASSTTGTGTVVITGGCGISGQLTVNTIVETSSIAFKENVNPISNALDSILQLMGVTYDRKDTKRHEAGLIAEEVFKIIPDVVSTDKDGNPHGIQYTKLTAYLVEAIKSLKEEINSLKESK